MDYSIGFGGATKSTGLTLRHMPDVQPVILTSQQKHIRDLWYGSLPTYVFRTTVNYRTRSLIDEWMRGHKVPMALQRFVRRGLAIIDAVVEQANALRVWQIIRRHGIQIVQLNNGPMPREAVLGARLARVPAIVYLRGFFHQDTGWRRNISDSSWVIGDSRAVTQSYTSSFPTPLPNTTIYETVDVAAFDRISHMRSDIRTQWGIVDDDIAVGLFGRIVDWKGQREFVLAMLDALAHEPRLKVCLVGDSSDGSTAYQDEVFALIRASAMKERFVLTGYVSQVEPLNVAMDIVVHASIVPEPCGMVILEGMAARRPVIAMAEGGPPELVVDGVTGLLVPPRNVPALTEAVLALSKDAGRRQQMGERGYARMKSEFDVPVIAEQFRQVYGDLLHRVRDEAKHPPRLPT